MAVSPVNLCADLQAWHSAGLSFLYFPDVDAAALIKDAPRQAAAKRLAAPTAAASPESASANSNAKDIVTFAISSAPEQVSATARPIADSPSSAPENTPLPAAWEALLQKVKPAPVVWTYKELGEDLMVKGDPARSQALRELIGSLGLKGGTSAFLPVVLPGGPCDGSQAWCFQAMLGRLGGRILVSFGPEALALGPYASLGLEPFREKIVQGRMILCLPSFTEILADPARFEATKVFLRSAFAKINIL